MNLNNVDTKDLTSEKNLLAIYKASRRILFSSFNYYTTLAVGILLTFTAIFSDLTTDYVVGLIRGMADYGLSMSLSILGLLIAGFTIFATLTSPQLSIEMSRSIKKSTGLTHLKHNYFVFLRVFIYYLAFSVFCLFVLMFGHAGGLMSMGIDILPNPDIWKHVIARAAYVSIFTGFYFLIMQLKSFVFNMYHSVMTMLRWEAENNHN